jgi:DNA polymerase III subunit delta'
VIIGHQRILEYLKKSVQKEKIAHAYLFTGPENVGKRTIAIEFIRMLQGENCPSTSSRLSSGLRLGNNFILSSSNGYCPSERSESKTDINFYPDILIIEPLAAEKGDIKKEKEIGIDEARQIRRQMSLSPYQAPYKITLIDQAERMTREAANALLKTLEEPSGQAVLILITANPQLLLPTIISRCQIVKFLPVPFSEMNVLNSKFQIPDSRFQQIIRLSSGRPGLAIQYLENPKLLEKQEETLKELQRILQLDLNKRYQYVENLSKDTIQARKTLNQWLIYFRDLLLTLINCKDLTLFDSFHADYSLFQIKNIIQAVKKTDLLLSNSSINVRLALEVLMLEF